MKPPLVFPLLLFLISGAALAQSGFSFDRDMADAFSQMDKAFVQEPEEFTPQDEYYLGRSVAAAILARYPPLPSPLTKYLNLICNALAVNSPQPHRYNGYHVTILESPELNAFGTPGGHIFICRGMVEAAGSEDALAALIAHEMAHIQLRHGIEAINAMQLTWDLSDTADHAAAIIDRDLPERTLLLDRSVRDMVNTLVSNGYSQAQEFAADSYALQLLSKAGYSPASMVDMLSILEKTRQTGGLNSTHPAPILRISCVRDALRQYPAQDTHSFRSARYRTYAGRF
jgi:predicted Zn-dependent protease